MQEEELNIWFANNKNILETAYIQGKAPWQQSGVGLRTSRTAQDWEILRRPIADGMTHSGTFLDIGCANGYLIECVLRWTHEQNIEIEPYGLDFSEEMVTLARQRLPEYSKHIFLGNAWNWLPPQQFTYVNSGLEYVPEELQPAYVQRLLDLYVAPDGALLITDYQGRSTSPHEQKIDVRLKQWGFRVSQVISSHLEHDTKARTDLAILKK